MIARRIVAFDVGEIVQDLVMLAWMVIRETGLAPSKPIILHKAA